jgi:hypothetical protein
MLASPKKFFNHEGKHCFFPCAITARLTSRGARHVGVGEWIGRNVPRSDHH